MERTMRRSAERLLKTYFFPYAERLLLVMAIAIFWAHLSVYWNAYVDDAYITFRYARNFAHGLGLVFNPGEKVEGYTSVLWTLWIGLGIKLGFDPLLFAKLSGGLLGTATLIYVAYRAHAVVSVCIACSGVFSYWAVMGLESPLFVLNLVVAVGELQRRRFLRSAVLFGLLPWVRPDGLLFTVCLLAPVLAFEWRAAKDKPDFAPENLIKILAAVAVPYFALLAWRYGYYHATQPNTYYAKIAWPWHNGFWKQFRLRGIPYVTDFWRAHFWLGIAALGSIAFAVVKRWKFFIVLHAAMLLYQGYFMFAGGDWMSEFRWYSPLIVLYLAASFPAAHFVFNTHRHARFGRLRYAVVAVCFTLLTTSLLRQSLQGYAGSGHLRYEAKHNTLLQILGRLLSTDEPFEETILLGDIGVIGYESNLHVVDGAGLIDSYIAKLPAIHFWKSDLAYFLTTNPEWVVARFHYFYNPPDARTISEFEAALATQPSKLVFTADLWKRMAQAGRWVYEQQLLASDEFHARYGTVFVTPEFDQPQYLALFCRRDVCDSEKAKRLTAWAPNLGHIKAQFGMPDADYYLERTTEIVEDDDSSALELARRLNNRKMMRAIASDWQTGPTNQVRAYTALGLDEYEWKEFNRARDDFKSAIESGGTEKFNYDNLGFAYDALGQKTEAQKWFNKK